MIEDLFSENNAVYIVSKNGKTLAEHNIDKPFRSASVIKLFILAYYLEHGESLDEIVDIRTGDMIDYSNITELNIQSSTVGELLMLMIACSDNTATNVLINRVGMAEINAFMRDKIGTQHTVLGRLMLDYAAPKEGRDNFTSLSDVKKCLDLCLCHEYGKRVLSAQKCRDRLMRYIYKDVDFYGKAGEIPKVFNDVGYIDGAFAGVLSDGMRPSEAAVLCGKAGLRVLTENREPQIIL